jgi:hypothetical protein
MSSVLSLILKAKLFAELLVPMGAALGLRPEAELNIVFESKLMKMS